MPFPNRLLRAATAPAGMGALVDNGDGFQPDRSQFYRGA